MPRKKAWIPASDRNPGFCLSQPLLREHKGAIYLRFPIFRCLCYIPQPVPYREPLTRLNDPADAPLTPEVHMPQTSRCALYLSPFLSSPVRAEMDEEKPSGFVRNHASTEGISRDAYFGARGKNESLDPGWKAYPAAERLIRGGTPDAPERKSPQVTNGLWTGDQADQWQGDGGWRGMRLPRGRR